MAGIVRQPNANTQTPPPSLHSHPRRLPKFSSWPPCQHLLGGELKTINVEGVAHTLPEIPAKSFPQAKEGPCQGSSSLSRSEEQLSLSGVGEQFFFLHESLRRNELVDGFSEVFSLQKAEMKWIHFIQLECNFQCSWSCAFSLCMHRRTSSPGIISFPLLQCGTEGMTPRFPN